MRASARGLLLLLTAVLVVSLVDAGAATAKRPKFVAKKLPGYCGTVKPVFGEPVGVSVSARRDRWKRASTVSCAKARTVARTYFRDVVEHGQGSAGILQVGRYECGSVSGSVSEVTGHSGSCTSRRAVISIDQAPIRGANRLPCTAKRLSAALRGRYVGTKARMINHRCSGATAVAAIKYKGKTRRYAFQEFDGSWAPSRATSELLQGFTGPPNRLDLVTVNALGRAMGGKRVEKYRVGR